MCNDRVSTEVLMNVAVFRHLWNDGSCDVLRIILKVPHCPTLLVVDVREASNSRPGVRLSSSLHLEDDYHFQGPYNSVSTLRFSKPVGEQFRSSFWSILANRMYRMTGYHWRSDDLDFIIGRVLGQSSEWQSPLMPRITPGLFVTFPRPKRRMRSFAQWVKRILFRH